MVYLGAFLHKIAEKGFAHKILFDLFKMLTFAEATAMSQRVVSFLLPKLESV